MLCAERGSPAVSVAVGGAVVCQDGLVGSLWDHLGGKPVSATCCVTSG